MASWSADKTRAVGSRGDGTAEGYLHQLGIYASDDEFGDLICPFALGGLDGGEPVVFAYDEDKTKLLRSWLPETPGVTYVTDMGPYATPARALAGWRQVVESHLAAGARRVRIAGNVPHPGYGRPYAGWDRYEVALDRALGDLPVWAPCLYDARITPQDVLDTAVRRHRVLLDRDGNERSNGAFEPVARLADFLAPEPDPLERTDPALEFVDPRPRSMRLAVAQFTDSLVSPSQQDELCLAVSEAVTNALLYGEPPVTVRMWLGGDRVVIDVHDEGDGPVDPLVGLVPSGNAGAESGRGLWLAHRLDVEVALMALADGFTVRLRTGTRHDRKRLESL